MELKKNEIDGSDGIYNRIDIWPCPKRTQTKTKCKRTHIHNVMLICLLKSTYLGLVNVSNVKNESLSHSIHLQVSNLMDLMDILLPFFSFRFFFFFAKQRKANINKQTPLCWAYSMYRMHSHISHLLLGIKMKYIIQFKFIRVSVQIALWLCASYRRLFFYFSLGACKQTRTDMPPHCTLPALSSQFLAFPNK